LGEVASFLFVSDECPRQSLDVARVLQQVGFIKGAEIAGWTRVESHRAAVS
jgi:hypothetical protein